jgi:hypothetical protein
MTPAGREAVAEGGRSCAAALRAGGALPPEVLDTVARQLAGAQVRISDAGATLGPVGDLPGPLHFVRRGGCEAALAWWGVPRQARRERALGALRSMGASHLQDRPAAGLSGGEARRVHLARAIALEPDVLLLDEPFAGLDAPTRAGLLDDASTALTDPRRATVLVVHDRTEAWALADRILVLLDGRASAHGPVRDVLDAPPTPEIAAFVGFSGTLHQPDGTLRMLKPGHATLDPSGDIAATVTRRVPVEDGVRLELTLPNGRVHAYAPLPGPQPGDTVRLTLAAGITYPQAEINDAV